MPYADNGSVRIHYQVEGEGPALVLQHGFTESLADWYEAGYVQALSQRGPAIVYQYSFCAAFAVVFTLNLLNPTRSAWSRCYPRSGNGLMFGPVQYVKGRLAFMKAELEISDAQEQLF
jgi:hypothetical protein